MAALEIELAAAREREIKTALELERLAAEEREKLSPFKR